MHNMKTKQNTRTAGRFISWTLDINNLSVDCVFGEGFRSFGGTGDGVVRVIFPLVTVCKCDACDVDESLPEELECPVSVDPKPCV